MGRGGLGAEILRPANAFPSGRHRIQPHLRCDKKTGSLRWVLNGISSIFVGPVNLSTLKDLANRSDSAR
jgi:hypothetical protein